MKTKAFVLNMGFIILFYFLGTTLVVVLLNFFEYTFYQVSFVFMAMGLISLLLAGHYSRKMICVDCRTMNKILISILIVMSIFLLYSAYDMMQPWELLIF